MRKTTAVPSTLPRTFEGLCKLHWLRPIRDDVDYQNAIEIIDHLALLKKRTKDQDDYLESLSTLIEKYDKEQFDHEFAGRGAIESLKFLLDGHDMNASDLGRLLGNRTLGPAILRGERKISKSNALTLSGYFKVSAALFLEA